MNRIKFILGEDKHIRLLIRSPNNEPFTILQATYKLSIYGEIEKQDAAEIDKHHLDIKLSPQRKGYYELEITFKIADSIRKAKYEVEVV